MHGLNVDGKAIGMSFVIQGEPGKPPKNAKEITGSHLIQFYDRVIKTWKPSSEIWALTRGPVILGVGSALSGIFINSTFRRRLRLGYYGQFATYMPIAVLPTMMTVGFHKNVRFSILFCSFIGFIR